LIPISRANLILASHEIEMRGNQEEEIVECIGDHCGYEPGDWNDLEPIDQHRAVDEAYENWTSNFVGGGWFVAEG
ncbi:MAG: hypothetical protein AAFU78_22515, partial [Cyanobacteria bacterium J06633_2]